MQQGMLDEHAEAAVMSVGAAPVEHGRSGPRYGARARIPCPVPLVPELAGLVAEHDVVQVAGVGRGRLVEPPVAAPQIAEPRASAESVFDAGRVAPDGRHRPAVDDRVRLMRTGAVAVEPVVAPIVVHVEDVLPYTVNPSLVLREALRIPRGQSPHDIAGERPLRIRQDERWPIERVGNLRALARRRLVLVEDQQQVVRLGHPRRIVRGRTLLGRQIGLPARGLVELLVDRRAPESLQTVVAQIEHVGFAVRTPEVGCQAFGRGSQFLGKLLPQLAHDQRHAAGVEP